VAEDAEPKENRKMPPVERERCLRLAALKHHTSTHKAKENQVGVDTSSQCAPSKVLKNSKKKEAKKKRLKEASDDSSDSGDATEEVEEVDEKGEEEEEQEEEEKKKTKTTKKKKVEKKITTKETVTKTDKKKKEKVEAEEDENGEDIWHWKSGELMKVMDGTTGKEVGTCVMVNSRVDTTKFGEGAGSIQVDEEAGQGW
jgi:hypothetical protein